MKIIHATFAFMLCEKIKSLMSSMKNCLPLSSMNADNQFPKHIAAAGTVAVLSLRYTVTKNIKKVFMDTRFSFLNTFHFVDFHKNT